jgi:hypothetical protein
VPKLAIRLQPASPLLSPLSQYFASLQNVIILALTELYGTLLTSTYLIILFSKKKKVEKINFLRFSLQLSKKQLL